MTAGNIKIVSIVMKEKRGKPIAFLKNIINPYKGISIGGNQSQLLTLIPYFLMEKREVSFGAHDKGL